MGMTRMQVYVLGVAVGLAPLSMAAQVPTTPTGAANPATPAIASASTSPFGTDTSANGVSSPDAQTMKDKMFLRKATQGGLAEVQFGQLAVQKASSEDVKKFGQRMVDDHTMMNETMKPLAQALGIMPPSKLGKGDQAELDKLNGLSGADFDKEYLAYMSKDHHKDLMEFQQEEESTTDPALKEAVANGTRMIAKHTRIADKLAVANGVMPAPPAK